jgi:hypothetical protein
MKQILYVKTVTSFLEVSVRYNLLSHDHNFKKSYKISYEILEIFDAFLR